ncbi:MAG: hypothetical protein K9H61_11590 [Bacteroidia bacterium]|nr:hypothetical protein [Bacteroidia bacterium]MCF8426447.1 hypothetical protein [Bacteroidia bacterium]MCF8447631.1 hypothetical protein [Bacteroidia bacterium]
MFKHLLPNKFKKIGWALIFLVCPLFLIFFPKSILTIDQLVDIVSIIALIGLLLTIGSEEKLEDERTSICRYKALAGAFLAFISITITAKLLSLIPIISYIIPGHLHKENIIDNPMWLIYFAAFFYHINFRALVRNEE